MSSEHKARQARSKILDLAEIEKKIQTAIIGYHTDYGYTVIVYTRGHVDLPPVVDGVRIFAEES